MNKLFCRPTKRTKDNITNRHPKHFRLTSISRTCSLNRQTSALWRCSGACLNPKRRDSKKKESKWRAQRKSRRSSRRLQLCWLSLAFIRKMLNVTLNGLHQASKLKKCRWPVTTKYIKLQRRSLLLTTWSPHKVRIPIKNAAAQPYQTPSDVHSETVKLLWVLWISTTMETPKS